MTNLEIEQALNNIVNFQPMVAASENGIMIQNMLAVLQSIETIENVLKSDTVNDSYKMNMQAKITELEMFYSSLAFQRLAERGIQIVSMPTMPQTMMPNMMGAQMMPNMMGAQMMPNMMGQAAYMAQPMPQPMPQMPQPQQMPQQTAQPAPMPSTPVQERVEPAMPATEVQTKGKGGNGGGLFTGPSGGGDEAPAGAAAGRDFLLSLLEKK